MVEKEVIDGRQWTAKIEKCPQEWQNSNFTPTTDPFAEDSEPDLQEILNRSVGEDVPCNSELGYLDFCYGLVDPHNAPKSTIPVEKVSILKELKEEGKVVYNDEGLPSLFNEDEFEQEKEVETLSVFEQKGYSEVVDTCGKSCNPNVKEMRKAKRKEVMPAPPTDFIEDNPISATGGHFNVSFSEIDKKPLHTELKTVFEQNSKSKKKTKKSKKNNKIQIKDLFDFEGIRNSGLWFTQLKMLKLDKSVFSSKELYSEKVTGFSEDKEEQIFAIFTGKIFPYNFD
jgi:hypothetical protein